MTALKTFDTGQLDGEISVFAPEELSRYGLFDGIIKATGKRLIT